MVLGKALDMECRKVYRMASRMGCHMELGMHTAFRKVLHTAFHMGQLYTHSFLWPRIVVR